MLDIINELHFHSKWFEYNFLSKAFFDEQIDLFRHSEAEENLGWQCLEHHRYLAFRTILSSQEGLTNNQLEQYIKLCQLDEDKTMARSALIDLLLWPKLTDEQYVAIIGHPAFSNPVAQKIIWRNQMFAELQSSAIPHAIFTEIRERKDPVIERELVSCESISKKQLEILATEGISRAVRNKAINRLGRR